MRKLYEVLVIPSCGNGNSYWTEVNAINPPQARKIVAAQIPSDWTVGSTAREVH
jgi:hypothetical protein